MKYSLFLLGLALEANECGAQPILSNGFGYMAAVNGTTYTKTTNVGTANYGSVGASGDGQLFYAAGGGMLYFIRVSDNAFVDSMALPTSMGEFASGNEAQSLFTGGGNALYRINSQTKSIDSIALGNAPFRVEERPNAKEVWVAADSMVHVISYTSGLSSQGTIKTSSNKYDNGDVRFTKGGSIAYKCAPSRKKIYKIDAATRTITDSIDTAPLSHAFVQPSTDSSKLYACNGGTILIYSIAAKAIVDSIISPLKTTVNIYRHPLRAEIWTVDHFADSVGVFDESNKNMIAGIPIGPDPFFLAFSTGTVGIKNIAISKAQAVLYPNPATNMLHLAVTDSKSRIVDVYDYAGRKLSTTAMHEPNCTINIESLAKGNYYLTIYQAGALEKSIPFVKE